MPACARLGDPAGGPITATATTVLVNGVPVARLGDPVVPHGIGPHAVAVIVGASMNVEAEGIAVTRLGDSASCGDSVSGGSSDVTVN